MKNLKSLGIILSLTLAYTSHMPGRAAEAHPDSKSRWLDLSGPVTAQVKSDWPGLTAGVAVDRADGTVYMILSGQGVWKSTDQGTNFTRVDGKVIGGRCETGYALCADPKGGRLFCFMLDGPSGYTLDAGQHWTGLTQVGRGWDYAAVDWSVEKPQVIYGLEHESGGKVWLSTNAGQTWTRLGEAPTIGNAAPFGVGVFGANTLVRWRGREGIERSTDTGATWAKVSSEVPVSHVMGIFQGTGYWLGEKGLLVSQDRGATWTLQGAPVAGGWGPYFGKEAQHLVVVGKDGVQETTDGGRSWQLVATLPGGFEDLKIPGWFLNFGFDPGHHSFYVSRMGKPTYRCRRELTRDR